jgi:cytochrome c553
LALVLLALQACGSGSASPSNDASTADVPESDSPASDAPASDVPDVDAAESDGPGADESGLDASPEVPPPPGPYPRPTYTTLAETGLLDDPVTRRIAADAIPFEPTYWLWSDGADKRRWLRLPPGTRIDTTAMDHWVFPIGTKLWKEFSLGGVLLETRLIERYGDGPEDYWMGAFVWNVDQTDAVLAPDGQTDINGTPHDAPAQKDCLACHRGDTGRVLGFSALQLSRAADSARVGPTLTDIIRQNLLSAPPEAGSAPPFSVPGDPTTAAALGYLHANCGHCHNRNGTAWPDTQMVLRLTTHETDAASSDVYRSLVGQPLQYWRGGAITKRVTPGDPDASAVVARMSARGNDDQMPPIATEQTDPTGIARVRAWIASLPATAMP